MTMGIQRQHLHPQNLRGHLGERAVRENEFVGVDHCFELRDKNAIARLVVGDPYHPVARRLGNCSVDEVTRQADYVCKNRHSHFRIFSLPHKASGEGDRKVICPTLNLKLNKKYGYRASPGSISTGGCWHNLHSAGAA